MNFERIGIEGMHFEVPEGWAAKKIEKLKDGLTLEVTDDQGAIRLIVKSSPLKKGSINPDKVLKGLKKRLGKKAELNTNPKMAGLRKPLKRFPDLTVFSFTEPAGLEGCGFVAQRNERKDAVLAVAFKHQDKDFNTVTRVLTSLSEDAYNDDQIWEFQGLSISLPSAFHFSSYKYDKRGYMRLVVSDARAEMALERFSGATVLLAQMKSLSRIWVEASRKDIATFELIKEREIETPHHGIYFHRDTQSSLIRRVKAFLRRIAPFGKPYFLAGYLWNCDQSNRIIGLKTAGRKPQDAALVEDLIHRVSCCSKTSAHT